MVNGENMGSDTNTAKEPQAPARQKKDSNNASFWSQSTCSLIIESKANVNFIRLDNV